jgi:hypothetical protein
LEWIETHHGLPEDVRSALKELVQKINASTTKRTSRSVSKLAKSIAEENRQQKLGFENAFRTKNSTENEQALSTEELQNEIQRMEQHLEKLKKQKQERIFSTSNKKN